MQDREGVFFKGRTEQLSSAPGHNWSGFPHKQATFCFQHLIGSFTHVPTSQKVNSRNSARDFFLLSGRDVNHPRSTQGTQWHLAKGTHAMSCTLKVSPAPKPPGRHTMWSSFSSCSPQEHHTPTRLWKFSLISTKKPHKNLLRKKSWNATKKWQE